MAGCVLFAIFFYVVALISVPAIVFFPAYSIYFFAPRYRPPEPGAIPAPSRFAAPDVKHLAAPRTPRNSSHPTASIRARVGADAFVRPEEQSDECPPPEPARKQADRVLGEVNNIPQRLPTLRG